MPRKVAFSAKQKREQIRRKRALKRGDSPPPAAKPDKKNRKSKRIRAGPSQKSAPSGDSERLQSSFVRLPSKFLQETQLLASTLHLQRPIPPDVTILNPSFPHSQSESDRFTCPTRPKWRYDATKNEVEKNEEGWFKTWLDKTDGLIAKYFEFQEENDPGDDEQPDTTPTTMPHAPTSFERNLEVWRQLWRVTEIAQILLILLDSRCPILHYPPSLAAYLSLPHIANRTQIVLVLTKVDIAGTARTDAWARFMRVKYPNLRIVQVEAYVEKSASAGSGQRRHYEPHLPTVFRKSLVNALKEAHEALLQPPEQVRGQPEILKDWTPSVKRSIDWDSVLNASGDLVGTAVGGATGHIGEEKPAGESDDERAVTTRVEPEFLTVGLIGQPNVGKSSLLNALFGVPKVKVSKTPGKTKHFQTLFWTSEVRLVDCPGLVMPNYVPMEAQVLCGILPISRVSAIPLCIHYAAQLLPLERILGLSHPSINSQPEQVEDKRTWRAPRPRDLESKERKEPAWTALDILTAYALKKGWITARTGWPDVNRAGNAILRAVAENRIHWAFWPPGTEVTDTLDGGVNTGQGIWIPDTQHGDGFHDEFDTASEAGSVSDDADDSLDDDDEVTEDSEEDTLGGRFDALLLEEDNDTDNED